jgi:hypothetical protein
MRSPYFPVDYRSISVRWSFVRIDSEEVQCDGLTIRSFPVNHPHGAVAYRIESSGASVVYATDLENVDTRLDSILRDYACIRATCGRTAPCRLPSREQLASLHPIAVRFRFFANTTPLGHFTQSGYESGELRL